MYQYVSAQGKVKSKRARWKAIDVHQMTFDEIIKKYSDVIFTLTNSFLVGTRYMTLKQMLEKGIKTDMTPPQWFNYLNNTPVSDSATPPVIEAVQMRARDAWRVGFDIQYTNHLYHPATVLPLSSSPDLMINKGGVAPQDLYENTLFTVNGLIHLSDYNSHGVYVIQGSQSVQLANMNNIAAMNFGDLGTIQQIPITAPMINDADSGKPYSEGFYINTGVDMTNKTPLLIAGGYMHAMDEVYEVVNYELGIIKVYMKRINLMHRIFESRKLISLATMALSTHQMNEGIINNSELYSNTVLASYMTLPQSFIALIDTPSIYVEKHPLECAQLDGLFYATKDPIFPIQIRSGILPEYWAREEDGINVLSITDSKSRNYLFQTTQWRDEFYTEDTLDPVNPFSNTKAFFLEIGKETVTM